MAAFNRSILVRRVGSSRIDRVTIGGKQVPCIWVLVEFTRLVKVNVLILAVGTVLSEEVLKPMQWGSFGNARVPVLHLSKMIGDQNPCSLAIDTLEILPSSRIVGLNTGESKIN